MNSRVLGLIVRVLIKYIIYLRFVRLYVARDLPTHRAKQYHGGPALMLFLVWTNIFVQTISVFWHPISRGVFVQSTSNLWFKNAYIGHHLGLVSLWYNKIPYCHPLTVTLWKFHERNCIL